MGVSFLMFCCHASLAANQRPAKAYSRVDARMPYRGCVADRSIPSTSRRDCVLDIVAILNEGGQSRREGDLGNEGMSQRRFWPAERCLRLGRY